MHMMNMKQRRTEKGMGIDKSPYAHDEYETEE